jgi:prepilin-type N-terminal cleavage/methylation domain-containing protein
MRQAGFSLVEVLVALALTALVMVVLFAGVGLGLRGIGSVEGAAGDLDTRRNLEAVLRRQLAAAYPGFGPLTREPGFVGAPQAVSFLALNGPDGPGLARVWLVLEDGNDGRRLVLSRTRPGGGLVRAVLARHVASFRLAYLGAPNREAGRGWHDRWEGSRNLPELVRVSLRLAGDGEGRWPDEVVRLWASEAIR